MQFNTKAILKGIQGAILRYNEECKNESLSREALERKSRFEWIVAHGNCKDNSDRLANLLLIRINKMLNKDPAWDSRLLRYIKLSLMHSLGIIKAKRYDFYALEPDIYIYQLYLEKITCIMSKLGFITHEEWDNVFDEEMPTVFYDTSNIPMQTFYIHSSM